MKLKYLKQYAERSKVVHYFYPDRVRVTVCGVSIAWYEPNSYQWKNDVEGIKVRRPCMTCVHIKR